MFSDGGGLPPRRGIAVLLAAVALFGTALLEVRPPAKDARQNLVMAHNLASYGVASVEESLGAPPVADARREPLYPFLMSVVLRPRSPSLQCLLAGGADCRAESLLLRLLGLFFHVATVGLTYLVARRFVAAGCALAAAAVVGFSPMLVTPATTLLTEAPAGALLLLATWCLLKQDESRGFGWAALGGAALGALALVKGIAFFAAPTALVVLALLGPRGARARALAGSSAALLVAALVVAPWSVRNAALLGTVLPSAGEGPVLAVRAQSLEMTPLEYASGFVFHTGLVGERAARALFADAHYRRHDRQEPDSFYARALSDPDPDAARARISGDPVKHLALSLPYAWRGAFGAIPLGTTAPAWWPAPGRGLLLTLAAVGVVVRWVAFAALLTWAVPRSLRERRVAVLAVPAATMFAWYALTTHFIPRYGAPLLPVAVVSAVAAAQVMLRRPRRRHGGTSGRA